MRGLAGQKIQAAGAGTGRFLHGREWRRVVAVGLLGAGLSAAVISTASTIGAPLWLAAIVGCALVLLTSQSLLLTDPARVVTISAEAMAAMVGVVVLSPVQFLITLSIGQAVGWSLGRVRQGVPLTTGTAGLKFAASQAMNLAYIATVLILYHTIGPQGSVTSVAAAALAVVGAEVIGVMSMAYFIGRAGREPLSRQLLQLARSPVYWLVLLMGAMAATLAASPVRTAAWLSAASTCLWALGLQQHRQHAELIRLRGLVDVAGDIPTAVDRDTLTSFLIERARSLTHAGSASLDNEQPSGSSVGMPVDADNELWLNVHERTKGGETFRASERETLRGLASLGSLALQTVAVTEELRHAATHDQLTGLVSRRGLEEYWRAASRRAARHGRSLGVIYVDLDGFKQINDREGHAAGDAILRETGRRMANVARDSDIVCRLGGDEFVLVAEDVTDVTALEALAQRLDAVLTATDDSRPINASLGTALHPEHGSFLEDVLKAADTQMYAAKRSVPEAPEHATPDLGRP